MALPEVAAVGGSADPLTLAALWAERPAVVLVDAVTADAPPGTLIGLPARRQPLPCGLFPTSTHALGLPEAIELARALDGLPEVLVVLGIVGRRFRVGEPPSPSVVQGAGRAARAVAAAAAEVRIAGPQALYCLAVAPERCAELGERHDRDDLDDRL